MVFAMRRVIDIILSLRTDIGLVIQKLLFRYKFVVYIVLSTLPQSLDITLLLASLVCVLCELQTSRLHRPEGQQSSCQNRLTVKTVKIMRLLPYLARVMPTSLFEQRDPRHSRFLV